MGQYADAAKGMLQMIGATIQTNYQNPDAKKERNHQPLTSPQRRGRTSSWKKSEK
jgi:hypothetical protein